MVKRVVAVAGDEVEIRDGELYINGGKLKRTSVGPAKVETPIVIMHGEIMLEKNGDAEYRIFIGTAEEKYENAEEKYGNFVIDFPPFTVPRNSCFVLGDNRNYSEDSSQFGPIPLATIKGRAEYIYWPAKDWSRFGPIK